MCGFFLFFGVNRAQARMPEIKRKKNYSGIF